MATVRISKQLLEDVSNRVDSMHKSEIRELASDTAFDAAELPLCVHDALWAAAPHLEMQMPKEWVCAKDQFDLHFIGDVLGPTTGKHMRELGCAQYPIVSDEEFKRFMNDAMVCAALDGIGEKLNGTN